MRHAVKSIVPVVTTVAIGITLSACGSSSSEPGENSDLPLAPAIEEDEGDDPSESDKGPTTTKAPVPAVKAPAGVNDAFVGGSLNSIRSALGEPDVARDMSQVLSGQALEDFENQRIELDVNDLRMEGHTEIVSSRLVEKPAEGTEIHEVCVDNSGVKTLDENNHEITSPQAQARSKMLITFMEDGDAWVVERISFADDPNC